MMELGKPCTFVLINQYSNEPYATLTHRDLAVLSAIRLIFVKYPCLAHRLVSCHLLELGVELGAEE